MNRAARAVDLLRQKPLWIAPLVFGTVLIAIITILYLGSTVDPIAHMHGLPVSIVNQDDGARAGGREVQLGREVEAALGSIPEVSDKLALKPQTQAEANDRMDSGHAYATVFIPPDFSAAALTLAGWPIAAQGPRHAPEIWIYANQRAGTQGASLASTSLQVALGAISVHIGDQLEATAPSRSAATKAALAEPVRQVPTYYRPLPSGSALGLGAFYVSLLTLMCGFLGAAIVNGVLDGALGFAPTEFGPHWSMRRPVLISRWQTLLAKWAMAVLVSGLMAALMLLVAVGVLGMDAPEPVLLWLYSWLCAATVAVGTLALIAAVGAQGQLLALLIFIYLGLASAGGTTPIEALPEVLHAVSHLDPLRQILGGVRSILYFESRGDAGLDQGLLFTLLGLAFWFAFGTFFVRRYDRKGRDRLDPALIKYVNDSVDKYREQGNESG